MSRSCGTGFFNGVMTLKLHQLFPSAVATVQLPLDPLDLAGHLQTLPLITHRFPVAQAADAWALIESKREPVLGVILDWQ